MNRSSFLALGCLLLLVPPGLAKPKPAPAKPAATPEAAKPAASEPKPGEVYGVVEIGSSGIKALVIKTVPAVESAEVPPVEILKEYEPLNKNPFAVSVKGDAAAADRLKTGIASAVSQRRQEMEKEFSLPESHFYLVGSSGLKAEAREIISQITFNESTIEYISPEKEAVLVFRGIVPAKRLPQVVVLDVGSGNTKGGYLDGAGTPPNFASFALPLGTKSAADAINAGRGEEDFKAAATTFKNRTLRPSVQATVRDLPGLQNRTRLYVAGGTPWVMATVLHPEQVPPLEAQGDPEKLNKYAWVRLTAKEIEHYITVASTNPADLFTPKFLPAGKRTPAAEAELAKVQGIFNQDQLTAGAVVMKCFLDEMKIANKDAIFFSRKALFAWPMGYVLEKIAAEK